MLRWLGLPAEASAHATRIDLIITLVHWLMLAMFVGWSIFFVYVLIRFRRGAHPKARYEGTSGHWARGAEIGILAGARGFSSVRRATGALSGPATQIYIADTMGELGLFYRAAPFAFLGGSLVSRGGQNPLEPARLGTAILTGPHTHNFEEIFRVLLNAQGEGRVQSPGELGARAAELIADPAKAKRLGAAAREAAGALGGALAITLETAENLLASHART